MRWKGRDIEDMRLHILSFIFLFALSVFSASAQIKVKEDSLLIRYSQAQDPEEKLSLSLELSQLYRNVNSDKSLDYAQTALSHIRKDSDYRMVIRAYINYGIAKFYLDDYIEAITKFNTALNLAHIHSDERHEIMALSSLGNVYSSINDNKTALKYYSDALSLSHRDSSNHEYLPTLYGNIGLIHLNDKNYSDAEEYLLEAARTSSRDNKYLINFYNNLAEIFLIKKDLENCIKYIRLAESLHDNGNINISEIAHTELCKAEYYLTQKDTSNALVSLKNAKRLGEEVKSSSILKEVTLRLYQISKEKKDTEKALAYLEQYNEYNNKLINSEKVQEITNIRHQEQIKRQEENLKNANIQNKLKIRLNIYFSIIIALISVSVTIFALMKYKKARKARIRLENELELKNKELTSKIIFLIERNEIMNNIISELKSINNSTPANAKAKTIDLIRNLEKNIDNSLFNTFDTHFSHIHEKFYDNLKNIVPDISPAELRVCALLRMNLSSKEIAALINISPGSVDVMRTKIRKKLGLSDPKINLTSYLMKF